MIKLAKPQISRKEKKAVNKVLRSGTLVQGPEVKEFELEFGTQIDNRPCVAVNSGTSGLHISLLASGIGPGDEVIIPSFSFAATANAVALTGAKPIFVDIDLDTYNISPIEINRAISSRTKAIQPVHLYGLPANMREITQIADSNGLLILEDAAQAHFASIEGKAVGSFGKAATFSFYPTKNMTTAEGGMIVCEDYELARLCRLYRNQGMEKRYENEIVGFNSRMSEIHAAIGRVQLKRLDKWTQKRRDIANFYNENLSGVVLPYVPEGYKHVYHQYTIRIEGHDRDSFAEEMLKKGVTSGVYYPTPCHELRPFKSKLDLPNTQLAAKQVLSIPVHPMLSQRDIEQIVKVVNEVASAGS